MELATSKNLIDIGISNNGLVLSTPGPNIRYIAIYQNGVNSRTILIPFKYMYVPYIEQCMFDVCNRTFFAAMVTCSSYVNKIATKTFCGICALFYCQDAKLCIIFACQ